MSSPSFKQEGSQPPGVLPRNINVWVLGAIVVVVLGASFFSGQKATKSPPPTTVTGPTTAQMKSFEETLNRERAQALARLELEQKRRREEEERQRQLAERSNPPRVDSSSTDRLVEERRRREAQAPFAPMVVLRIEPKEETRTGSSAGQIAFRAEVVEERSSKEKAPAESPLLQESGRALVLHDRNLHLLIEGTLVPTLLVNRLEGSFTGPVICEVSADVYAEDRTAVLIPKGSRFYGQAQRVEAQNQSRLAVSFNRLVRADKKYSVDLGKAPGLDRTGATGLKDKVNNHYLRSFGISGAIGLLGGLALYGRGGPYATGVGNMMGSSATNILSRFLNRVPDITIREGHSVAVYLPEDLVLPEYRP